MTAEPEKINTAMIARADAPADGTELHIQEADGQGHHVHVFVQAMTPVAAILVRTARTYLQALVGFLLFALAGGAVLEGVGVVVKPGDFWSALVASAGLAVAPAAISLLQNVIELLAKLDEKFPRARA